ncbi:unnamed protein product, partial [marine sediment metagenome]
FCYDKIISQNIYPNDTTIIIFLSSFSREYYDNKKIIFEHTN